MFIVLGGGLLIIIIAVIIAVVSSVVSRQPLNVKIIVSTQSKDNNFSIQIPLLL